MSSVLSDVAQKKISVVPMNAGVGAEIIGVDLAKKMDDDTFSQVRNAFNTHSVILFRGQRITEEQHISFSRKFGDLVIHILSHQLHPKHPEILVVSNIVENGRNIGSYDAGRHWHSDLSYSPTPSMGSILYALEVPHDDQGNPLGDTMFANTVAAYDSLPEEIKQKVAGLKALFSIEKHFNHYFVDKENNGAKMEPLAPETKTAAIRQDGKKEAIHPVIRTHPVTGRKSIYVEPGHTVKILGIPEQESKELLELLHAQCIRPEFLYRHKWKVGDVIMWDNAAVQHLAVIDYKLPHRRRMQRTTILGTVPF